MDRQPVVGKFLVHRATKTKMQDLGETARNSGRSNMLSYHANITLGTIIAQASSIPHTISGVCKRWCHQNQRNLKDSGVFPTDGPDWEHSPDRTPGLESLD